MTMPEEIDFMDRVDTVPWGPTEPDETAVLDRLFATDLSAGTYGFRIGSLAPNTVAAALNEANKWVGTSGRPNVFTRDYAKRHGGDYLSVAWCDMFQTWVARHAPAIAITPHGDRAYTPWHAADFEHLNQAHPGTMANVIKYAVPGTVLFFDWNGTDLSPRVDHVGMVVTNLHDGRVVTIEGNTMDKVALRTRGSDVIATIGIPDYVREAPAAPKPLGIKWPYKSNTVMRKGWLKSRGVMKVQGKINELGYRPVLIVDGDFGMKTEAGVRWAQKKLKVGVDGQVGPITWKALFR